jgi:hypothetical protein
MSTRKLGTYATKEEFLENEVRTLNFYIQSMIDTMKDTSMNRQDMLDELERMKLEIKTAVLAEREACAKVCEQTNDGTPYNLAEACAEAIRARGQE